MDVRYSTELKQSAELSALLRQFSGQLAGAIDPDYLPAIRAEWSVTRDDGGRVLYRIVLEDPAGRVSKDFTRDELAIPLYMKLSLLMLWGDLLHIHSEKQHAKVERVYREFLAEQREPAHHGD